MALALDRVGCRVAVFAYRGFGYRHDFPLSSRLETLRAEARSQRWDLVFDYPLNYERLRAQRKAGFLVYETTELPPHWVQAITRHLDLLVVPSSFCQQVAQRSGVDPQSITVIPYGYDPGRFFPCIKPTGGGSPPNRFVFLCIAMPHLRKGLRELVQAFREEFSADEPVELIIKVPYLPPKGSRRRPWELEAVEDLMPMEDSHASSTPRIRLVQGSDPPGRMPSWIAMCDAYVQPSYGEGFGLSILEAKAIGRPTLVTGWGGHMDYCSGDNSFLIDYELIPAGEAQYDHRSPSALCAQPVVGSLRAQMRTVFENPGEAQEKARRSLRDICGLTWEAAALQLVETLRDPARLTSSIKRSGLLVPPVLRGRSEGRYQIVCGSRRVEALRCLGREWVEAFTVSDNEWTDADCLRRSISENRWHRGFNDVERAMLFLRIQERFLSVLPSLGDLLVDDLKVPTEDGAMESYRFILGLPHTVRNGLAQGRISLGQALLLQGFPTDARTHFYRIMLDCGLTLQESRKAAEWIHAVGLRDWGDPFKYMEDPALTNILQASMPARQKAGRLLSALRKRRFPVLETWEAKVAAAHSQLGVKDKGVQITHDPSFETTQIRIQIQGKSRDELGHKLERLHRAIREGRMDPLFQALTVESIEGGSVDRKRKEFI
jgi:glycosyltransferase involved in cell wall biosynthesis